MEDEIAMERRFFDNVRLWYETALSKLLAKFPLKEKTISDLSFLDSRSRIIKTSSASIVCLAKRFLTDNPDEIDAIVADFLSFQVAPHSPLPSFDINIDAGINHFWSLMGKQTAIGPDGFSQQVWLMILV